MYNPLSKLTKRSIASSPIARIFSGARSVGYGSKTSSGQDIGLRDLLSIPGVRQGVNGISETIGGLPYDIYLRGTTTIAPPSHPMYEFMLNPNHYYDGIAFRTITLRQIIFYGFSIHKFSRSRAGGYISSNYRPDAVDIAVSGEGIPKITYNNPDKLLARSQTVPFNETLFFSNYGINGFDGFGLLDLFAERAGVIKAAWRYTESSFKNGMQPLTILSTGMALTEEQMDAALDNWVSARQSDSGVVILTGNGASDTQNWNVDSFSVNFQETQLVELQKFLIQETARALDIPPTMIGDDAASTFNNISENLKQFIRQTLRPYISMLESGLNRAGAKMNPPVTVVFKTDDLDLETMKERYESYAFATNKNGWFLPNEIRKKEGYEPLTEAELEALRSFQPESGGSQSNGSN